jgi:uncharacterized protein YaaQ
MNEEKHTPEERVDLLVLVVLASEQVGELSSKLVKNGYRITLVNTSGGFMQTGATCLLVGIPSARFDDLEKLIGSVCHTHRQYIPTGAHLGFTDTLPPMMIEAEVGSAYIYTLEVEHYEFF